MPNHARLSPLNRTRVAAHASVAVSTVSNYEDGARMLDATIERIEAALDGLSLARFKRATKGDAR